MSQKRRKFDRAASSAGGAHLVGGDALYPGLQAGFGAESWQVLPGFGEGVLDGVLGVVGVAVEHGGGVPEHSGAVAVDDVGEGGPITQGRATGQDLVVGPGWGVLGHRWRCSCALLWSW